MPEPIVLLLIDEDPADPPLADWLSAAGWTVLRAESLADGVRRCRDAPPAAVIVDVGPLASEGAAFCALLRLQPYGDRITTVLLAAPGASAADSALSGRPIGVDVVLPRPVAREDLLAAFGRREPPPAPAPGLHLGAVRVPQVDIWGHPAPAAAREEGALGPGVLLPILDRLHRARFTGVLEATGEGGLRAKLFFFRGAPAAARSNDEATGFGHVLRALGIVSDVHLEASVEQGRQSGAPLGEVLLRSHLLHRGGVERALREQILQRAVGIGRLAVGHYVIDPAAPFGLAGFDVHPATIAYRLEPAAAPELGDLERDHFVHVEPEFTRAWPLLDPHAEHGLPRALLVGGATVRDCVRVGGPRIAQLIATLSAWGLVRVSATPPAADQREAGLAELGVEPLADALYADHRALSGADHYTMLGLQPDADADAVEIATVATLARFQPDAVPAALDALSRARAQALHDRALDAGRVLGDPNRRAVYDAWLGGVAPPPLSPLRMEDHAVLQAERARELFRRDEFVTAAALFHMAILLEGEAPDILAMLGWARHRACPEDPQAGEAELQRAVALQPQDEYALTCLARLLASRRDTAEAGRLLRAALDLNHEYAPARAALRELDE